MIYSFTIATFLFVVMIAVSALQTGSAAHVANNLQEVSKERDSRPVFRSTALKIDIEEVSANSRSMALEIDLQEVSNEQELRAALLPMTTAKFMNNISLTKELNCGQLQQFKIDGQGYALIGSGNHRLIHVWGPGAWVSLHNLTLTRGKASEGGAVKVSSGGTTGISFATFVNNDATGFGAALWSGGANTVVKVSDSAMLSNVNSRHFGGAIYVGQRSLLEMGRCELIENRAEAMGGAIYVRSGTAIVSDSYFRGNKGHAAYGDPSVMNEVNQLQGEVILAGVEFDPSENLVGIIEVNSGCEAGSFKESSWTVACSSSYFGCTSSTYPSYSISTACTSCSEGLTTSCCGAESQSQCIANTTSSSLEECSATQLSSCPTTLELGFMPTYAPSPAPTMVPTEEMYDPSPAPTMVPTEASSKILSPTPTQLPILSDTNAPSLIGEPTSSPTQIVLVASATSPTSFLCDDEEDDLFGIAAIPASVNYILSHIGCLTILWALYKAGAYAWALLSMPESNGEITNICDVLEVDERGESSLATGDVELVAPTSPMGGCENKI